MGDAGTFSGTRLAPAYFAVQAAAILAWWTSLLLRPHWRVAFRPAGAEDADLLAFAFPDSAAAVLSILAAVALARRSAWGPPLAWAATGMMGASTLYVLAWALLRDGGWLAVACMVPAATMSALFALDASAPRVAVFRRAKRRTRAGHIAATFGWIVVFWGFFLAVLPPCIAYVERAMGIAAYAFPGQRPLAVALLAAASTLGLWSGITMARFGEGTPLPLDATSKLVVRGPYRWIRNPMVVAGLAQGLAVVLWLGSTLGLAYVALGAALWNWVVRPAEERDLAATFGAEYESYRARVPLWVPRRPRGGDNAHEGG